MPGGDRTGPMGMGPMTGRAAGFCAGFGVPGFRHGGYGAGGRGRGRGRRNMFYATGLTGWQRAAMGVTAGAAAAAQTMPSAAASEEVELQMLRAQADAAAAMLDQVRRRIDEIAAAKTSSAEAP